jgi:origin recognition complex subunit 3
VDNLLDEDDTDSVRKLLDDDKNLAMEAQAQIKLGQAKMRSIFAGIECLMGIREFIGGLKGLTRTELMIQALRGELGDSKILEDLLTSIRKTPSDSLHELLGLLPEEVTGVGELSDDFDALLQRTEGSNPLRSKYDDHHSTHKTTVVGQSLKLSRTRAKLSKEDTEYTTLIERLHATLEEYLTDTFINPETLFMHEAFLTDHRAPLKDTFTPRARFVVEIGLSSPADYLGNDAGDDEDGLEHLSASQPAVSILYQLYMESGAFINIYDLWRAFYTIIGGEDGEGCDERLGLTAFYRALAELKMMGMIKPTRKKPDHLSKSTWVGL